MNVTLKYPWMRESLLEFLRVLADFDHEHPTWTYSETPDEPEHVLPAEAIHTEVIHFLYGDTGLDDDTWGLVGVILRDNDEADAIHNLIRKFDTALDHFDIGFVNASTYTESPEWKAVIEAAKDALAVLNAS